MYKAIILLLLLSFLGLSAACGKPKPAATADTPKTAPAAWKMNLFTVPEPPVTGKEASFVVKLTDEAGKPVAGAQVNASLVMPLMDMGKNEVTLADKGAGSYQGTGKFTMAGPWNVVVTAAAQGKSAQQVFPVVVHE